MDMDAYAASVSKKIAEGKLLTGIIMELQYDSENYCEEENRDKKWMLLYSQTSRMMFKRSTRWLYIDIRRGRMFVCA